jgi:hypothetical protein
LDFGLSRLEHFGYGCVFGAEAKAALGVYTDPCIDIASSCEKG